MRTNDRVVLDEFLRLYDRYGAPPSIREVMTEARLSSTSVTHSALERLVVRGWLTRARGEVDEGRYPNRNYLPTEEGRKAVAQ